MKTPEEIKKGLREAPHVKYFADDPSSADGRDVRYGVVIGYVLREEIVALIERLAQVERERDAAVADLSNSCQYCKFASTAVDEAQCASCIKPKNAWLFSPRVRTKFEWRGVCAENRKDDAVV